MAALPCSVWVENTAFIICNYTNSWGNVYKSSILLGICKSALNLLSCVWNMQKTKQKNPETHLNALNWCVQPTDEKGEKKNTFVWVKLPSFSLSALGINLSVNESLALLGNNRQLQQRSFCNLLMSELCLLVSCQFLQLSSLFPLHSNVRTLPEKTYSVQGSIGIIQQNTIFPNMNKKYLKNFCPFCI